MYNPNFLIVAITLTLVLGGCKRSVELEEINDPRTIKEEEKYIEKLTYFSYGLEQLGEKLTPAIHTKDPLILLWSLEELTKDEQTNLFMLKNEAGETLLHIVSKWEIADEHRKTYRQLLKLLLSLQFGLMEKDNSGMAPIHHAASSGSIITLEAFIGLPYLSEKGKLSLILLRNKQGETLLHMISRWQIHKQQRVAYKRLLDNVLNYFNPIEPDNNGMTSIHHAAETGNTMALRTFIKHLKGIVGEKFMNSKINLAQKNKNARTAYELAIENKQERVIQLFITDPTFDYGVRYYAHLAAKNGLLGVLKKLHDTHQLDLYALDDGGKTLLYYAFAEGNVETVRFFKDLIRFADMVKVSINAPTMHTDKPMLRIDPSTETLSLVYALQNKDPVVKKCLSGSLDFYNALNLIVSNSISDSANIPQSFIEELLTNKQQQKEFCKAIFYIYRIKPDLGNLAVQTINKIEKMLVQANSSIVKVAMEIASELTSEEVNYFLEMAANNPQESLYSHQNKEGDTIFHIALKKGDPTRNIDTYYALLSNVFDAEDLRIRNKKGQTIFMLLLQYGTRKMVDEFFDKYPQLLADKYDYDKQGNSVIDYVLLYKKYTVHRLLKLIGKISPTIVLTDSTGKNQTICSQTHKIKFKPLYQKGNESGQLTWIVDMSETPPTLEEYLRPYFCQSGYATNNRYNPTTDTVEFVVKPIVSHPQ